MPAPEKQRVLCVDDELNVLEGLSLVLRRRFDVSTAPSGQEGLKALGQREFAVVISDMRMPGMSGADFLAKARVAAPDATRMLLTGHTDIDSAVRAINEGQIFRFLTKPCAPDGLVAAVDAAVEQHRLVVAERELLQRTLRGCVASMTEVLALANPAAFGHAIRVRHYVVEIGRRVGHTPLWEVEVASMLAQLGGAALPEAIAEKVESGAQLDDQERSMAANVSAAAARLLADIPRIDGVRQIIEEATRDAASDALSPGSRILRLASDYVVLERRGVSGAEAIQALRLRAARYDPKLLEALDEMDKKSRERVVAELPVSRLRAGMRLMSDVKMPNGALVIRSGNDVTAALLERLRNLASTRRLQEPIRVMLPLDDTKG